MGVWVVKVSWSLSSPGIRASTSGRGRGRKKGGVEQGSIVPGCPDFCDFSGVAQVGHSSLIPPLPQKKQLSPPIHSSGTRRRALAYVHDLSPLACLQSSASSWHARRVVHAGLVNIWIPAASLVFGHWSGYPVVVTRDRVMRKSQHSYFTGICHVTHSHCLRDSLRDRSVRMLRTFGTRFTRKAQPT